MKLFKHYFSYEPIVVLFSNFKIIVKLYILFYNNITHFFKLFETKKKFLSLYI